MSDFGRCFGKTSKIGKLFVALATSNVQELFEMNFESKSSRFERKIFFWGAL